MFLLHLSIRTDTISISLISSGVWPQVEHGDISVKRLVWHGIGIVHEHGFAQHDASKYARDHEPRASSWAQVSPIEPTKGRSTCKRKEQQDILEVCVPYVHYPSYTCESS